MIQSRPGTLEEITHSTNNNIQPDRQVDSLRYRMLKAVYDLRSKDYNFDKDVSSIMSMSKSDLEREIKEMEVWQQENDSSSRASS